MRCRMFATVAITAVLLMGAEHQTPRLHAQSPAPSSGIPNLTGYWNGGLVGQPRPGAPPRSGGGGRGGGGGYARGVEGDLVKLLNARAKAVIAAFDEYASPKYDCVGVAAPHIIIDLFKQRIEQRPDRVIFYYEKDDVVRTVWLEGHNHPEPRASEAFLQGYSTGRYEGGQLVVVTTKFTYDPMGMTFNSPFVPSSTRKKVTERYWREGNVMKAIVVTEDPVFLLKPWTFTHEWDASDDEFYEYGCNVGTARQLLQFIPPKYVDK